MKLLVIEDDAQTLSYLHKGLVEEGFDVETALDGETGLNLALSGRFDLAVLDILLPRKDGWSVLTELRHQSSRLAILVLTARDSVEHRVRGLSFGADDYLVKPFAFSELVARIRCILRRPLLHASAVLEFADLELDCRKFRALRSEREIELSAKEFQLLELLLAHQGTVLSREFIAKRVWDMLSDGMSNVVDVNIRRLRAKLDEPFDRRLIHTIRGRGYVLR